MHSNHVMYAVADKSNFNFISNILNKIETQGLNKYNNKPKGIRNEKLTPNVNLST